MQSSRRRIAVGVLGAAALTAPALWFFLRQRPIVPAPPNPFLREYSFHRTDTNTPVGDIVEMRASAGFYAELTFAPASVRPLTFEGREVQPPSTWPLMLLIYERGGNPSDKETLRGPCVRTTAVAPALLRASKAMGLRTRARITTTCPIGIPAYWSNSGYREPLDPPETPAREDELQYWTYFAVSDNDPREYVYELNLYPTAAPISAIRFHLGPPVVLQRGLLRVVTEDVARES